MVPSSAIDSLLLPGFKQNTAVSQVVNLSPFTSTEYTGGKKAIYYIFTTVEYWVAQEVGNEPTYWTCQYNTYAAHRFKDVTVDTPYGLPQRNWRWNMLMGHDFPPCNCIKIKLRALWSPCLANEIPVLCVFSTWYLSGSYCRWINAELNFRNLLQIIHFRVNSLCTYTI